MVSKHYDTLIVGTGFASAFFLYEYLKWAPENERILVLERGSVNQGSPGKKYAETKGIPSHTTFINLNPSKFWLQKIGFGGGTCWLGNTPRMHPNDFHTQTLYGRGDDWPFGYDELESYYCDAEEIMGIAGLDSPIYPRSRPYPLPAHRFNAFDRELAKKYPGKYLPMPSARASTFDSGRSVCCTNGVCSTCPIAAKFQVDFHLSQIFKDPRVTLVTEANVKALEIANNRVTGAYYEKEGSMYEMSCNLAAVGAHGIMTPFIFLKSGLNDPALGRYLNEQIGVHVDILLDKIQNYDGSQLMTGFGVMKLDGDFRREHPGFYVGNWNLPWLRAERGRWRERGAIFLTFEELPQKRNYVAISKDDPDFPEVNYLDHSDYGKRGLALAESFVDELLTGLPVESYKVRHPKNLGGQIHIQGTTRMGADPQNSVVDDCQVHHNVRNLLALGSGVFPTCPAANPTLTLVALSLRAARKLFSNKSK